MQANLSFLQAEEGTASNCSRAWSSLRKYESFFPNMRIGARLDEQYQSNRPQCLILAKQLAESLRLGADVALDAILMLDRLAHYKQDLVSRVGTALQLGAAKTESAAASTPSTGLLSSLHVCSDLQRRHFCMHAAYS